MKLRVLGCAGAEFPGHHPPAFLLNDSILIDAGTVGVALTEEEQLAIRHIFITHTHLDHIRGIAPLADTIINSSCHHQVKVGGIGEHIAALRAHLFNNVIYPDFATIPMATPVVRYVEVVPEQEMPVEEFTITPYRVNHIVPAVGYVVSDGKTAFLYTGDTGPTSRIWREAQSVSAAIVEVSFPNEREDLALITGHLTPRLLVQELEKMNGTPQILITHLKPQYRETIKEQISALGIPQIELLEEGKIYQF